jgi:phosphomannomutase
MARSNGTLIASISGIRGIFGDGLDPDVLVRYAGAFGTWCRQRAGEVAPDASPTVVVGRDARTTGPLCADLVMATLRSTGCSVVDAGLATTPTVEMAVLKEKAAGGIVLSASHNPEPWNALKLLNEKGEFLAPSDGEKVNDMADARSALTVPHDAIGEQRTADFLDHHIAAIKNLDLVDPSAIAGQDFRVVVDGVNSVGGVALPALLEALGVNPDRITRLNCEPTGRFAHPAEPRPEHLTELTETVANTGADLGLAVDPDADRLALVDNEGRFVSEELTQVIAADFVWRHRSGPFVTNLSSSRAIDDVAARHDATVYRSAVGEINVVRRMQETGAILGGEGNGGVILPDLHYGRDALAGTALVLQHLAERDTSLAALHDDLPRYAIVKDQLPIDAFDVEANRILKEVARRYEDETLSAIDGLKIDFPDTWVHMRPSNTEPILRIYAEAADATAAERLAERFKGELRAAAEAVEG